MLNLIAKSIKITDLNFSEETTRRLANLAMTVELRAHKRFSVSKTADLLVELINLSAKHQHVEISAAYKSLLVSLDEQQKSLLIGFGAEIATAPTPTPPKPDGDKKLDAIDKKYLRGARG